MRRSVDSLAVNLCGPMGKYAVGIDAYLAGLGYTWGSRGVSLKLVEHLSVWMLIGGFGVEDLTRARLQEFVAIYRVQFAAPVTVGTLMPVMDYLRDQGLVPQEHAARVDDPVLVLLEAFGKHLVEDRLIGEKSARSYALAVRPLLEALAGGGRLDLAVLTPSWLAGFLAVHMPTVSKGSVADVASALRSLLRFLASAEMVVADLAPLVPSCPRRKSWVPKAVPAEDVTRILASCGRDPVGLRDRAVILCLARLGLRAGEVAGMRCADIDWVTGVVTVRGKGHRLDQLPIPVDVGAALVDYLRRGRPPTNAGTVFLTVRAPIGGLAPSGVSHIVARAAVRAGLAPIMAHRLRHTAATESLNAGATLQEVSLLLRHANPATTMIYAKADLGRLAGIARPWPMVGAGHD